MRSSALLVAVAMLVIACASPGPSVRPAGPGDSVGTSTDIVGAASTTLASPAESTQNQPEITNPPTEAPTPMFGFGLSPRSYQGADLPDFLDLIEGNTDILMHAGDWLDLERPNSAFYVVAALAEQRDLKTLAVISPNNAGELIRPIDDSVRSRYLQALRSFVAETRPDYLGLANEVNMLATDDPDGFSAVVSLWPDALAVVREESPGTSVFVTFQFEWLLGRQDGWFGRSRTDPGWDLVDQFPGADAVGFTSYPSLVFDDPSELVDDYYTRIREYTDLAVYFTEIGWTAEPDIAILPGSESDQVEFIDMLGRDAQGKLGAEVLVWAFVHDDLVTDIPFTGMGLWRPDGTARPAWTTWLNLRLQ